MASFQIEWKKSVQKELKALSAQMIRRIIRVVEQLSKEPFPSGSVKLTGSQHTHRIRVGDYRVIYNVLTQSVVIEIIRVGHRGDVYR